jgi:hypothetical protein
LAVSAPEKRTTDAAAAEPGGRGSGQRSGGGPGGRSGGRPRTGSAPEGQRPAATVRYLAFWSLTWACVLPCCPDCLVHAIRLQSRVLGCYTLVMHASCLPNVQVRFVLQTVRGVRCRTAQSRGLVTAQHRLSRCPRVGAGPSWCDD